MFGYVINTTENQCQMLKLWTFIENLVYIVTSFQRFSNIKCDFNTGEKGDRIISHQCIQYLLTNAIGC